VLLLKTAQSSKDNKKQFPDDLWMYVYVVLHASMRGLLSNLPKSVFFLSGKKMLYTSNGEFF
jgi:hypothetical protein